MCYVWWWLFVVVAPDRQKIEYIHVLCCGQMLSGGKHPYKDKLVNVFTIFLSNQCKMTVYELLWRDDELKKREKERLGEGVEKS